MSGQPVTVFAIPPGVRFVRQDSESRNQETASTQMGLPFEVFLEGTQPAAAATPPASEVRRDIRRLDRQRQSAVRPTSEQLPTFPETYSGGN
jgi:hypothetical protein